MSNWVAAFSRIERYTYNLDEIVDSIRRWETSRGIRKYKFVQVHCLAVAYRESSEVTILNHVQYDEQKLVRA